MEKMTITLTMEQVSEAVEHYLNDKILAYGAKYLVEDYQTYPAKAPREIKYFLEKKKEATDEST